MTGKDLGKRLAVFAYSALATAAVCTGVLAAPSGNAKKAATAPSTMQTRAATSTAATGTVALPPPLDPAGTIPDYVRVYVTGRSAPRSYYMNAVSDEISSRVSIRGPGGNTKVEVERAMLAPSALKAGRHADILVPARIYLPGFAAVQKHVVVRVENVPLEGFPPAEKTVVSNSPESVDMQGELISGDISPSAMARFMLHHRNISGGPLKLVLLIENPGTDTALVRISGNRVLRISKDEMVAGHKAALDYMQLSRDALGTLMEIPPGTTKPVVRQQFLAMQTISGMLDVQALRGSGLKYSVRVMSPNTPDLTKLRDIGNYTTRRAHGEFQAPLVQLNDTYTIGGRWRFISVGDPPLFSLDGRNAALHGNYGVTYNIDVAIENPDTATATVLLDFAPAGGPALGAFYVDGNFVDIKLVKPPSTATIATYTLRPGETRHVNIQSIPEAGSNYPVRVVVKQKRKS